VWIAGATLQVLVIAEYLAIAAERTPPFEARGVGMKVLQVGLLATCTWLALRAPRVAGATGRRASVA
jgi:hypothetical protein